MDDDWKISPMAMESTIELIELACTVSNTSGALAENMDVLSKQLIVVLIGHYYKPREFGGRYSRRQTQRERNCCDSRNLE